MNCGQKNRSSARFCISCGFNMEIEEPPVMTNQDDKPVLTSKEEVAPVVSPSEDSYDVLEPPGNDLLELEMGEDLAEPEPQEENSQILSEPEIAPKAADFGEVETDETEFSTIEQILDDAQAQEEPELPNSFIGELIQNRYEITESHTSANGQIIYLANDLRTCFSCNTYQNDEQAMYCESCGAELIKWPTVELVPLTRVADPEHFLWINSEPYDVNIQLNQIQGPEVHVFGLSSGYLTDTGNQREINEDSVLVLQLSALTSTQPVPQIGFYAVADGIGGHDAGDLASHAAVQALGGQVMQSILYPMLRGEMLTREAIRDRLKTVIYSANLHVLGMRHQAGNDNDMGCTLTTALVTNNQVIVANAGDSRTYLMKDGRLSRISRDHSLVMDMVERGEINAEDIYTHPEKHVIYRSLGDKPDFELDLFDLDLSEGDRLLLCSDGLWEMVRDPIIEDTLLATYDNQRACKQLVQLANQAGGEDNISVIIVGLHRL
jgi:serine/threonine protein phosphatase PrpC